MWIDTETPCPKRRSESQFQEGREAVCSDAGLSYKLSKMEWFRKALANEPRYLQSAISLYHLAFDLGDRNTAIEMAEHVRSQEGESPAWRNMYSRLVEASRT